MRTFIIVFIIAAVAVIGYRAFAPKSVVPSGESASPSIEPVPSPADAMPEQGTMRRTAGVAIRNFAYSPSPVTVTRGTVVTFTNGDSVAHTVTDDGNAFDSGTIAPGRTYVLDTADLAPGSYPYHCTIHSSMHGMLVVQ